MNQNDNAQSGKAVRRSALVRGRKPQYPSLSTVHGDKTTDRKNLLLPADLYERLLEMASELNYSHKGQVNVLPMLDALANLDIEEIEQMLRENGLLQKPSGSDRLWW